MGGLRVLRLHSRWFWGLRLYLVCTPAGMPILWALADPKIGEREVLAAMLDVEPDLAAGPARPDHDHRQGLRRPRTEADLARQHITLLRPARKDEPARPGEPLLKSIRQLIESVNDTLKGQLDLELHGGRTFEGVTIRVAQRILAMAAAIWHNNKTGQPSHPIPHRLRPLEIIRTYSSREMRRLLGLLRSGEPARDGEPEDATAAPRPASPAAATPLSLADIEGLAERMRAAGLDVTVRTSGEPCDVPAGIGLAGYRIVEEALTNALKHAAPRADHRPA